MANDDRVCHYRGQLDPRPFAFGAMALMGLCATVLLGILPIKSALAGFSDPTIWMIAAAFLFLAASLAPALDAAWVTGLFLNSAITR